MDVIDRLTKGVNNIKDNSHKIILSDEKITIIDKLSAIPEKQEEEDNIIFEEKKINNVINSKKRKEKNNWHCYNCFDSNIVQNEEIKRKNVLF